MSELIALVTLIVAAIQDIKKREVSPTIWLVATPVAAALTLIDTNILELAYLLASLLPAFVAFVLYRLCMIGGADVIALLFLAVAVPQGDGLLLPPTYLTITYSLLPAVAYQLYSNSLICRGGVACMLSQSHEVEVERLMNDERFRWWIPEGEACSEEDPREIIARAAGGDGGKLVRVSPGHPYVAHLAVGYILTILIGDLPLRLAMSALGLP